MNSAWGLVCVQTCVNIVTSVEGPRELLWPWVVFRWKILSLWNLGTVHLVRGLVQQILLQSLFWIFNCLSLSGERTWVHVSLLQLSHISFNLAVDLSIKLTIFPHLLESFMFIGPHWVFKCEISLTLISYRLSINQLYLPHHCKVGCLPFARDEFPQRLTSWYRSQHLLVGRKRFLRFWGLSLV